MSKRIPIFIVLIKSKAHIWSIYDVTSNIQNVEFYLLLMIRDDTTDKVGVGIPQSSHQFG